MALFFHDEVLFEDEDGLGLWLNEHWQEHLQFIRVGLTTTPPVFIADFNFAQWSWEPGEQARWLEAHSGVHDELRSFTGVSGSDLSVVDFTDETAWYEWMDSHAQEHSLIRQALGLS